MEIIIKYLVIFSVVFCLTYIVQYYLNKKIDNNLKHKLISLVFLTIGITRIVLDRKYYDLMIKDFTNVNFIILLAFIISLLIIGKILYIEDKDKDNDKRLEALKQAFIAFILAYCSRIDVVFAPFFLVYIFTYYYE